MADSPGSATRPPYGLQRVRVLSVPEIPRESLGHLCSAHRGLTWPGQHPQAPSVLAAGEGSLDTRPQDKTGGSSSVLAPESLMQTDPTPA